MLHDRVIGLFVQGAARIARNVHACAGVHRDYSPYMVTDLSLRARDRREDLGRDTNRIAKKELTISISTLSCKLFDNKWYTIPF